MDEKQRAAFEALAYDPATPPDVKLHALRELRRDDLVRHRDDFSDEVAGLSDEEIAERLDEAGVVWQPHVTSVERWPEYARKHLEWRAQEFARERVQAAEARLEERARVLAAEMTRERFQVVAQSEASELAEPEATQEPSRAEQDSRSPESAPGLVTYTSEELRQADLAWRRENPRGRRKRI